MKALSLTQPWATLIANGAKKIETRSWTTSYRGEIAIHASKGFPAWARRECFTSVFWKHLWPEIISTALPGTTPASAIAERIQSLPFGAIIALVNLVHVMPTVEIGRERVSVQQGWNHSQHVQPQAGTPEHAFGNHDAGRYMWFVENVRALRKPVACKGALSLWQVPPDIEAQVVEQVK